MATFAFNEKQRKGCTFGACYLQHATQQALINGKLQLAVEQDYYCQDSDIQELKAWNKAEKL